MLKIIFDVFEPLLLPIEEDDEFAGWVVTAIGGGTGGGGYMDRECLVDNDEDGKALLPSEGPGDRKPDAESVFNCTTTLTGCEVISSLKPLPFALKRDSGF